MKREELERYIGKPIKARIFNGDEMQGILHKTGEERYKNDYSLYLPKNWYFLEPERKYLFRCSHVRKAEEIK